MKNKVKSIEQIQKERREKIGKLIFKIITIFDITFISAFAGIGFLFWKGYSKNSLVLSFIIAIGSFIVTQPDWRR